MHMAHTNAWGSKLDLGGKKVKCQQRTIILAILVDLLSPIICAKIRAQGLFGSILGNPGVIHYVTLHSSPLGQLTDETSFSMNIHNTGEYLNS